MSTASTLGWSVIARHKIVAMVVAVSAIVALTIVLVLTIGSEPAASQPRPTPTVQQPIGPDHHLDCNVRRVVSFC